MANATLTLTDFLLARIAEDEQAARDDGADAMVGHRWKHYPVDAYEEIQSATLARCRRVLAECEAKRRIVEEAQRAENNCLAFLRSDKEEPAWLTVQRRALDKVQRSLALPYADHPDYDEEWRP